MSDFQDCQNKNNDGVDAKNVKKNYLYLTGDALI